MAKKRAGWERMVYYGAAGSAAATLIERATDVNLSLTNAFVETTDRGDGSAVPKKTEQIVQRVREPSFSLRYKDGDATVAALIAAAEAGTAVAIKIVRYSGGATEFDGDCYLEMSSPGPLAGEMVMEFTGHPTDDSGRAWT